MNPREQACAAVQAAQDNRNTRAEHKALKVAYRVTHDILGYPLKARQGGKEAAQVPLGAVSGGAAPEGLLSRVWARIWGRS